MNGYNKTSRQFGERFVLLTSHEALSLINNYLDSVEKCSTTASGSSNNSFK